VHARRRATGLAVTALLAVGTLLVAAMGGDASTFTVGSTSCSLSFAARQANVRCTARLGAVAIELRDSSLTTVMTAPGGAVYGIGSFGRLSSVAPAPGTRTTYT
jgi:hypothetical protein